MKTFNKILIRGVVLFFYSCKEDLSTAINPKTWLERYLYQNKGFSISDQFMLTSVNQDNWVNLIGAKLFNTQ